MIIKEEVIGSPGEEKDFEVTNPKVLEFFYLKKQLKAFDEYRKMTEAKKNSPGKFQKLKELWGKNKKEIAEIEKNLPKELVESYAEKINRSEELVRKKFEEVKKETDALEAKGEVLLKEKKPETVTEKPVPVSELKEGEWRSLWAIGNKIKEGKPLPPGVNKEAVERQLKMIGKSQGKNTLTYAYWEGILKDLKGQQAKESEKEKTKPKEIKKEGRGFWGRRR